MLSSLALLANICFNLDDTEHVLSGRRRQDEDTLRDHNWKTLREIQSNRDDLIYFDPSEWDESQVHILTAVDTVHFTCEEQRHDPMGKMERWFDHKSHSEGVKYEMAMPLCLNRVRFVFVSRKCNTGEIY